MARGRERAGAPGARGAHFRNGGPRKNPPGKSWALVAAGAVLAAIALTACGGDPPQIVDYGPQRNTIDVSLSGQQFF